MATMGKALKPCNHAACAWGGFHSCISVVVHSRGNMTIDMWCPNVTRFWQDSIQICAGHLWILRNEGLILPASTEIHHGGSRSLIALNNSVRLYEKKRYSTTSHFWHCATSAFCIHKKEKTNALPSLGTWVLLGWYCLIYTPPVILSLCGSIEQGPYCRSPVEGVHRVTWAWRHKYS